MPAKVAAAAVGINEKVVEFQTLRAALYGHGTALKRLGVLPSPAVLPEGGCAGSEAYSSPAGAW